MVIAIIAFISALALPSLSSYFKISLNSATRDIASIVKEAYNSTAMTGKVHRIVFDLKEQNYWVEVGPANVLLDTTESLEKEKQRKKYTNKGDEAPAGPAFEMDRGVTRKKLSLPRGVVFEDVITEQSTEPIKETKAYSHFFPQGITEQTLIHLKDSENNHITLAITPIVGRTRLVPGYMKTFEEAFNAELP